MAKAMKPQDKKDYQERLRANHSGNKSGADTTDKSRFLAVAYDYDHNHIPLSGERKKIYDEGKAKGW